MEILLVICALFALALCLRHLNQIKWERDTAYSRLNQLDRETQGNRVLTFIS